MKHQTLLSSVADLAAENDALRAFVAKQQAVIKAARCLLDSVEHAKPGVMLYLSDLRRSLLFNELRDALDALDALDKEQNG